MPDLVIGNTSPLFYLKAKQEGHISAVAPLLDRLIQLGFRLSDAVKASILKLAQE